MNEDNYTVVEQWIWDKELSEWKTKIIFEGTLKECSVYLDKYNSIGYNYSKLKLMKKTKKDFY